MNLEKSTKLKYPKSIFFIIGNEFCERFSFYGLKAILVLFFVTIQKYDNETSTMIYHMFMVCTYLSPFFGAIIADSYWGKYKTIYVLSIIHAVGNILVALSSFITSINIHFQRSFTIIGLLLTSIGAGGIKPCVSSFGGDQFVLPDQEDQLQKFFSVFYFSVNAGSLLSTLITPEMRKSVQCFGENSCFPLAFGVPAILMLISMVFFVFGKRLYQIKKPVSSIVASSTKCIFYALKNKIKASPDETKKKDWLEYASDKYSEQEIMDLRSALDVVYLFIPIPWFHALFDQQGSRWVLQGTLMNGKIDFLNWFIKPDQMHLINPLFVCIFIPVFHTFVYPILSKIGINTSLRKITLGGIIASLSFMCAAIVQNTITGESLALSPNEVQLRIYNHLNCKVAVSDSLIGNFSIEPHDVFYTDISPKLNETHVLSIDADPNCQLKMDIFKQYILIVKEKVSSYFLTYKNDEGIKLIHLKEVKKFKVGNPHLRILNDDDMFGHNITLRNIDKEFAEIRIQLSSNHQNYEIPIGTYGIYVNNEQVFQKVDFLPASDNDLTLYHNFNHTVDATLKTIKKGKYIHILWQAPQIILITISEVMIIISLLEFSFTQAPLSMKSFLTAIILCSQSIGNLLIVIISKMSLFENQAHEYLFYAIIMILDMGLFVLMSIRYKYKYIPNDSKIDLQEEEK